MMSHLNPKLFTNNYENEICLAANNKYTLPVFYARKNILELFRKYTLHSHLPILRDLFSNHGNNAVKYLMNYDSSF